MDLKFNLLSGKIQSTKKKPDQDRKCRRQYHLQLWLQTFLHMTYILNKILEKWLILFAV